MGTERNGLICGKRKQKMNGTVAGGRCPGEKVPEAL